MNCTQCGYQNPEGSRFCRQCGTPLQAPVETAPQPATSSAPPQPLQPEQPPLSEQPLQSEPQPQYQQSPQEAYAPPQPPYAPQPPLGQAQQPYPYTQPPYQAAPKKKNTGLIIGLVAGGVVLIAAAVVLVLLFMGGTPVTGQWYYEEVNRVLIFSDDNTVIGYSLAGSFEGDYTYDKGKAAGTLDANGDEYSFTVSKDALVLESADGDDEATFVKLQDDSDAEELVLKAMEGLWSSKEIGEVLEFKDGKVSVYSGYGDFDGAYDYDLEKGEGVFTVNNKDFAFNADYDLITVKDTGSYTRADSDIDIKAFVSEFAMPIMGMWYDTSGTYGTIEFYKDGTAEVVMFGQPLTATYTFDAAAGTGTFFTDISGETSTMKLSGGVIEIDGIKYTQEVVQQMGPEDIQATMAGTWYETSGVLGSVTFYDDGSVGMDMYSQYYTGTYTYDPISGEGELYLDTIGAGTSFYVQDYTLFIEDSAYTRDYVAPTTGIAGMWYETTGEASSINFYDDGSVLMNAYDMQMIGTYVFDVTTDSGTMTLSFADEPLTVDIYLHQGILDVDGVQYTQNYVE